MALLGVLAPWRFQFEVSGGATLLKADFFQLVDGLSGSLQSDEVLLCSLSAERSDFVRFNAARVRQAGSVDQHYLQLRLIHARRQAYASVALAGSAGDFALCRHTI